MKRIGELRQNLKKETADEIAGYMTDVDESFAKMEKKGLFGLFKR